MKPGDVVLIRFPQTDLQMGKLRPALVVAVAPGRHADLLLALISSRIHQAVSQFDEIIDPQTRITQLPVSRFNLLSGWHAWLAWKLQSSALALVVSRHNGCTR